MLIDITIDMIISLTSLSSYSNICDYDIPGIHRDQYKFARWKCICLNA